MLGTVIYAIYLVALLGATTLFVLKANNHWKVQKRIRNNLTATSRGCGKEYTQHKIAFTNSTLDALSWSAFAICGVYACFDCMVTILNRI